MGVREKLSGSTPVAIQYVRTPKHAHEVFQAYKLFSKILDPTLDRFFDSVSINWASKTLQESGNIIFCKENDEIPIKRCSLIDTHLIVLTDGSVAACCFDYNLSVFDGAMGNVRNEKLLDVWSGKNFGLLRKAFSSEDQNLIQPRCRGCVYLCPEEFWHLTPPISIPDALIQPASNGYLYLFSNNKKSSLRQIWRSTFGRIVL